MLKCDDRSAVTPCGWGVETDVRMNVWVAGKTV